jgi:periplasmic protein CpxP/Spy
MKRTFLNLAGVAALAAGIALGQGAPAPSGQHTRQGARQGTMVDRLATQLSLTPEQKQQAQTIFGAARQQAEPIRAQIRENRQALNAAVKSDSEADIDRISNTMGPLIAQATAIHSKAFAKFYQTLTPEQKVKMDQQFEKWHGEHAHPPSGANQPSAPPTSE